MTLEVRWKFRIVCVALHTIVSIILLLGPGATGLRWETDDAIIIEVESNKAFKNDNASARDKRQVFGIGGGLFPPGWPFGPGGPISIQQPQQPGINIPHFPSISSPPLGTLGPCRTNNGINGYCASFRQCYPILYSPDDGQIMNEGLAEMYRNMSGRCNGQDVPNFFMFRADAELRQSQVCCGSSQPSFPLGHPPNNIFHQVTMRPPWAINTTTTPAPMTTSTTTTRSPWTSTTTSTHSPWTWSTWQTSSTTNRYYPPPSTTRRYYPAPTSPTTVAPAPVASSCGVGKIVGGSEAQKGDFPWLVALVRNGRQTCGGTLIDDQHILTAAHCFNGVQSYELQSLFKVHIGDYDLHSLTDGAMTVKSISKLILHRQFHQQYFYNDIALLKLDSPVQFQDNGNNNIRPICLSQGGNYEGSVAYAAGWGRLSANSPYQPGKYRKVELKVWNLQQCANKYGSLAPGGITSQMMCAGQANKDSCLGDSGGPLMQQIGNRWEQIGLVSWGIGCGQYPGVYTKISDYRDWIDRHRSY